MPKNIQQTADLSVEEWQKFHWRKVHVGITGNHIVEDAVFCGLLTDWNRGMSIGIHVVPRLLKEVTGIKIKLNDGSLMDLSWGDIIELWPANNS